MPSPTIKIKFHDSNNAYQNIQEEIIDIEKFYHWMWLLEIDKHIIKTNSINADQIKQITIQLRYQYGSQILNHMSQNLHHPLLHTANQNNKEDICTIMGIEHRALLRSLLPYIKKYRDNHREVYHNNDQASYNNEQPQCELHKLYYHHPYYTLLTNTNTNTKIKTTLDDLSNHVRNHLTAILVVSVNKLLHTHMSIQYNNPTLTLEECSIQLMLSYYLKQLQNNQPIEFQIDLKLLALRLTQLNRNIITEQITPHDQNPYLFCQRYKINDAQYQEILFLTFIMVLDSKNSDPWDIFSAFHNYPHTIEIVTKSIDNAFNLRNNKEPLSETNAQLASYVQKRIQGLNINRITVDFISKIHKYTMPIIISPSSTINIFIKAHFSMLMIDLAQRHITNNDAQHRINALKDIANIISREVFQVYTIYCIGHIMIYQLQHYIQEWKHLKILFNNMNYNLQSLKIHEAVGSKLLDLYQYYPDDSSLLKEIQQLAQSLVDFYLNNALHALSILPDIKVFLNPIHQPKLTNLISLYELECVKILFNNTQPPLDIISDKEFIQYAGIYCNNVNKQNIPSYTMDYFIYYLATSSNQQSCTNLIKIIFTDTIKEMLNIIQKMREQPPSYLEPATITLTIFANLALDSTNVTYAQKFIKAVTPHISYLIEHTHPELHTHIINKLLLSYTIPKKTPLPLEHIVKCITLIPQDNEIKPSLLYHVCDNMSQYIIDNKFDLVALSFVQSIHIKNQLVNWNNAENKNDKIKVASLIVALFWRIKTQQPTINLYTIRYALLTQYIQKNINNWLPNFSSSIQSIINSDILYNTEFDHLFSLYQKVIAIESFKTPPHHLAYRAFEQFLKEYNGEENNIDLASILQKEATINKIHETVQTMSEKGEKHYHIIAGVFICTQDLQLKESIKNKIFYILPYIYSPFLIQRIIDDTPSIPNEINQYIRQIIQGNISEIDHDAINSALKQIRSSSNENMIKISNNIQKEIKELISNDMKIHLKNQRITHSNPYIKVLESKTEGILHEMSLKIVETQIQDYRDNIASCLNIKSQITSNNYYTYLGRLLFASNLLNKIIHLASNQLTLEESAAIRRFLSICNKLKHLGLPAHNKQICDIITEFHKSFITSFVKSIEHTSSPISSDKTALEETLQQILDIQTKSFTTLTKPTDIDIDIDTIQITLLPQLHPLWNSHLKISDLKTSFQQLKETLNMLNTSCHIVQKPRNNNSSPYAYIYPTEMMFRMLIFLKSMLTKKNYEKNRLYHEYHGLGMPLDMIQPLIIFFKTEPYKKLMDLRNDFIHNYDANNMQSNTKQWLNVLQKCAAKLTETISTYKKISNTDISDIEPLYKSNNINKTDVQISHNRNHKTPKRQDNNYPTSISSSTAPSNIENLLMANPNRYQVKIM